MRWLALSLVAVSACAPASPSRTTSALASGHVLFVDFSGGAITSGASDDAVAGVSSLGSAASYPAFDASIPAPGFSAAQAETVLIDRVRELYLPFDVGIVTTAPTSGDYARVLVGGTSMSLTPAQPSDIAGVGPVDCNDGNPRSLGFAFSDSLAPQFGGLVSLAATIAHEAGHGYGLEHVTQPLDPMYSVATPTQTLDDLFALAFQIGSYSSFTAGGGSFPEQCGHADPLDNHALLLTALGPRQGPLSALPTLSIDFPPVATTLPTRFPVELTATDDVGVVRVEIYRDLALVAILDAPPFRADLTFAVAASVTLTVEAIDADAQRARVSRTFAVDVDAPAYCDGATPCAAAAMCVQRFCQTAADLGVADASIPIDASVARTPGSSGCAMGGTPMSAPWVLMLLFVALSSARLRNRRR